MLAFFGEVQRNLWGLCQSKALGSGVQVLGRFRKSSERLPKMFWGWGVFVKGSSWFGVGSGKDSLEIPVKVPN